MNNGRGFNISGIQQVGVGTENFRKSWNWFIRMFGTDVKILEDDTVAERKIGRASCRERVSVAV